MKKERRGFLGRLADAVKKAASDFTRAIGIAPREPRRPSTPTRKERPKVRFLPPVEDKPRTTPPPSADRVERERQILENQARQNLLGAFPGLDTDEIEELVSMRGDRGHKAIRLDVTIKYPGQPDSRVVIPLGGTGNDLVERVLFYERSGHDIHGIEFFEGGLSGWPEDLPARSLFADDVNEYVTDELRAILGEPPEDYKPSPRRRKARRSKSGETKAEKARRLSRERSRAYKDRKFEESLEGLTPVEQKRKRRERRKRQDAQKGRKK